MSLASVIPQRNLGKVEQRIAVDKVVNDVMLHYIKTGDPILKLGYSVAKRMVQERVARLALEWDNKRIQNKVPKSYVGAPRDSQTKLREIIAEFNISDDGVVRDGSFKR